MYARTEPVHPNANSKGLYPLHRVIAENMIGRLLWPFEHVHHKDGNKFNNSPDNLEVLSRSDHAKLHKQPSEEAWVNAVCPVCNSAFRRRAHRYNTQSRRAIDGKVCCSRRCAGRKLI